MIVYLGHGLLGVVLVDGGLRHRRLRGACVRSVVAATAHVGGAEVFVWEGVNGCRRCLVWRIYDVLSSERLVWKSTVYRQQYKS
jgi:hypothetical protein